MSDDKKRAFAKLTITNADTGEKAEVELSFAFLSEIAAAVHNHGERVVHWSWQAFFAQFLPFAAVFLAEQDLVSLAATHELTPEQASDAIALMGALRKSENPHSAWVAAEIAARSAGDIGQFVLALQPAPEGEKKC